MKLTAKEKKNLIELIESGKPLPAVYKSKLFDRDDTEFIEATKDYKLVYKGKARKENIISQTPAAPFQKIRSFNSDNVFDDDWQNMLIFGDNLMALKTIYEDQRGPNIYKTKNHIKLIYIDPPFATKQDFMKDREKAYRDKIIGAQFIEFLRKRLVLMREILADNGAIYVHLDWKKGHYIKAIIDEVFGEHNFVNEIIWPYDTAGKGGSNFHRKHDMLLFYTKQKDLFQINTKEVSIQRKIGTAHLKHGFDENGREYYEDFSPRKSGKLYRWYLDEGVLPSDVWSDIGYLNPSASERVLIKYPTQKPENLIERCIKSGSKKNSDDIILDAFAGSGTTLAVSEKLNRRWIGMDCGKLSIYTIQKRMLNLSTQIGSAKKDEKKEYERVNDFEDHSKSKSKGLFLIFEKAKKGDFVITDTFLKNLSEFISNNLSENGKKEFSLICPENKLKLYKFKVIDNKDGKAGEKIVEVGKVQFLISFIQPKEKTEKEKPLKT